MKTLRPGLLAASLLASLTAVTGCRHGSQLPPATLAELRGTKESWLSGEVKGVEPRHLLNNKDFVYSLVVSQDGEKAAFTHLGPHNYQLGLWTLSGGPRQVSDPAINKYEFDVEALDFAADGKTVATASRDGALRFFNFDTGALVGEYRTEEPQVSVAFHPSGKYVVAGGAKGLVSVITFPELTFAFEQRAHEGEVRQVAFTADGTLYTGGWDKSIIAFESSVEDQPQNLARLRFDRRGGFSTVRGMVNGKAPAAFAFDSRMPFVVVTTEVAKAAPGARHLSGRLRRDRDVTSRRCNARPALAPLLNVCFDHSFRRPK